MLKNKIFYSFAIMAMCAAMLASCTGGSQTGDGESNTTSGLVSDVKEGISDVESDINDGGLGDREDATHGIGGSREDRDETPKFREAVPFGK